MNNIHAYEASSSSSMMPTIGLFISSVENKYENAILQGVADTLSQAGANLLCFDGGKLQARQDFERQRNILYSFVSRRTVDGLIISGVLSQYTNSEEIAHFCQHFAGIPIVATTSLAIKDIPNLWIDSQKGLQDALAHLIEDHGYRHIAFIRGLKGHQEADERYEVYRAMLQQYQLPFNPDLVLVGDYTRASGQSAMAALLQRPSIHFDAVVGANDLMALGALETLKTHGRQVPADVAVVGFDNIHESRYTTPPLTTVHQPIYEQGQQAAKIILGLLTGEEYTEQTLVPTRLVIRESCGCTELTPSKLADNRDPHFPTTNPPLSSQRDQICAHIIHTMQPIASTPIANWVHQLFDALTDGQHLTPNTFLSVLDKILNQEMPPGYDCEAWHQLLSMLYACIAPYLADEPGLVHSWYHISMRVGQLIERKQAAQRIQADRQAEILRQVSTALVATFEMKELFQIIAHQFPQLGIKRCYLSLYEESTSSIIQYGTLLLAYDENGRVSLPPEGKRFPIEHLIPKETRPSSAPYQMVVEALHFRENQLGLLLLEVAPQHMVVGDMLRRQTSSALQRILLLQLRHHTEQELARQATELEVVAQVSLATATILDSSKLLQTVVDLTQKSFDLKYVHVGLLDEVGSTIYLVAGAGELGRQIAANKTQISLSTQQSLIAQAVHTRQGVISNNVHTDVNYLAHPLMPGTQSEMVIPIIVGHKLIGVLDMQSQHLHNFSPDDLRTFTVLAAQVGVALENARRFEEAQAEASRLNLLNKMGTALGISRSLDDILQIAVSKTHQIMESEWVGVMLLNTKDGGSELAAFAGLDIMPLQTPLSLTETGTGEAMRQNQLLTLPTLEDTAAWTDVAAMKAQGLQSAMIMPLIASNQIIGTLNIGYQQPQVYTKRRENLIGQIASLLAAMIENQQLFAQMQKRAVALEESRQFLDSILENLPHPLFVTEAEESTIIRSNQANENLWGLERQAILGKRSDELFAKEVVNSIQAVDQEGMAKGNVVEIVEQVIHTSEDDLRILHTRNVPIVDAEGEPKYVLAISEDVTERKRLEQQVQHSLERRERQVQTSTEIAQEIAAAPALDELFWRVVHLVQKRFGYYHAHVYTLDGNDLVMLEGTGEVGRQLKATGHKIPYHSPKSLVAEAARTGQPVLVANVQNEPNWLPNLLLPETKSEIAVPIKLGNEVLGVLDVQNNRVDSLSTEDEILLVGLCGQIAIAIDYRRTEDLRKQAEEAQKRFIAILEATTDFVGIVDKNGRVWYVNHAGRHMLGIGEDEDISHMYVVDFHPEEINKLLINEGFPTAIREDVWMDETTFVSRSGQEIPTSQVIIAHKSPDDKVKYFSTIARDITQRRQNEEALRAYAQELERSNRELENFAYVASHDLQEPLRKIQAFSNRLQVKYAHSFDARGQDYLERMQKAASRMQTLIIDLLMFSRVTTTTQPFVPVDLNELIQEEVLTDLEARLKEVDGQIEIRHLPTIEADPIQMRQLFQNLLSNALKFHRPNVKPIIKIESQLLVQPADSYKILVSDNGIGFDEKYLDRIFNVFQRLHGRSQYEGTGVGLAVCRKIVEQHHGRITAQSTPGQGSTFIVTLPANQPEPMLKPEPLPHL